MASRAWLSLLLIPIVLVTGQQECYFGPGAESRGPSELVPCLDSGPSSCCLLGDTCLSGNTCYNYLTGDLYQYGCTDITYTDSVCPYKCGWNTTLSPWTAMEYCTDLPDVNNTWTCHAPESCGCDWNSSYDLLILNPRGCKDMGEDARVALYAPSVLVPYVSLPSTIGGSTGYYSTTVLNGTSTWISTAVSGYTPATITPFTTYKDLPTTIIQIDPGQTPSASTDAAASSVPASVSSTTSSTGPTSTAASTTNSTAPASTSRASTNSGLSTGAKAGIGVGVGLGVCAIAFAAIFFLLRQRRQKAQPQMQQQYPQGPQMQGASYYKPHDQGDWPGVYPGGPPQMSTPYYDPNRPSFHQDGTSTYTEVPKVAVSPPLELSAEPGLHELGSEVSGISSPAPTYVSTETPRS